MEIPKAKIYYFVGKKTFAYSQQGGSSQLSKLTMSILALECDEGSKASTFAQHHPCPISQSNWVFLITKKFHETKPCEERRICCQKFHKTITIW
jgi:hypothetical protein